MRANEQTAIHRIGRIGAIVESSERLSISAKTFLSFCFAILTGYLALVKIPLGFTPVPLTGQTAAVLLSGVFLGSGFGAFSQLLYVVLGTAGISWFTAGSSASIFGPTGGYLFGFILASALTGILTERNRFQSPQGLVFVLSLGSILILSMGTLYLAFYLGMDLRTAFMQGFLPFIPGDAIKVMLVSGLVGMARPTFRPVRD